MGKKNITLTAKFDCFIAVARSIMCYGAQVWGYHEYDTIKQLLHFFIKRIIGLPQSTPNYKLYLETA